MLQALGAAKQQAVLQLSVSLLTSPPVKLWMFFQFFSFKHNQMLSQKRQHEYIMIMAACG